MFLRKLNPISQAFVSINKNVDIVPIVKQIQDLVKEGKPFQEQFTKIAKNEMNCSATMFFKAKNNLEKMEMKRMSLYYLLSKFLTNQITLMSRQDLSKIKTELTNLLAMVDTYNTMITEDQAIPSSSHPAKNSNILSVLHNNR